jgi:excinuclease ABC subunit B
MAPRDQVFRIVSDLTPTGDQPGAIDSLTERLLRGDRAATLLGATGTGKTFTMAHVIERLQRPTLILSHNKTLAAQLYEEMRELFPHNAVSYFVSYYDYYQPEAYIPQRDIYIEKDAARNDDLDRLRLAATSSLLSRRDCIVVASVSCIFGLGSPEAYHERVLPLKVGDEIDRRTLFRSLSDMQYQRAEIEFKRGSFRVRGDTVDIYPAYEQYAVRLEMFGDTIESIALINPTSGEVLAEESMFFVFPAVHYVTKEDTLEGAIANIRAELDARVLELRSQGKLLEAQRLLARTRYDIEMMQEVGYCSGIENYSRHLDGRQPGERPFTLLDYFTAGPSTDGWTMMIDESHVTIPQIRAMYNGDRQRKLVLVDHGFRLPSALDNRPLTFEEFESIAPPLVFVSATPGPYELGRTGGDVVEQVIRPTGLLDPELEVRPAAGQVPDLLHECKLRAQRGERVLLTALTKRMCEDLTNYLHDQGVRVRYLHSEIETLDRLEILKELREGAFDVLVGVNLLREGLDLPEVSLVCILDADKTGFLRSPTSLIQTIGRAARNVEGRVILYADQITPAMRDAMDETERRRNRQREYNAAHGITPVTIKKAIRQGIEMELRARKTARRAVASDEPEYEVAQLIDMLREEMLEASAAMEFETAAALRDQIHRLEDGERSAKAPTKKLRRSEVEQPGDGRDAEKRPGSPGTRSGRSGRKPKKSKR